MTFQVTGSEHKLEVNFTKDTTYLALMDELWSVYCEDFGEKYLIITAYSICIEVIGYSSAYHAVYHQEMYSRPYGKFDGKCSGKLNIK